MVKELLFDLIGGVGLFFLGIKTMTESLKGMAGEKLKDTLGIITKMPIFGLLLGTLITALIQSSSATTVITVGFVNAGLLSLKQAISIILGANIGTTLTAWLVSFFALFKVTNYALPAIGLGFILTIIGKTEKTKMWGRFLLGFGLLFTGLSYIKDGFYPLKSSEAVKNFIITFGRYPLLGILAGVTITVLFQSSSATIAIVQIMAFSGLMDFNTAVPIILGDNIGTTITAKLASISMGRTARQAANAHAILNIIGVCYMIIPVYLGLYSKLIQLMVPGPITKENIMLHIALAHTTFNVINSVFIFLPLISLLEKVTIKVTPVGRDEINEEPLYLEPKLIDTPSVALDQTVKEIVRMLEMVYRNFVDSYNAFLQKNIKMKRKIQKTEDMINSFQNEIFHYLEKIFQRAIEKPEAEKIPGLIHVVNDIERAGDYTVKISRLLEMRFEGGLALSHGAESDVMDISSLCKKMFGETLIALKNSDHSGAEQAMDIYEDIKLLKNILKEKHLKRVYSGLCDMKSGVMFIDYIDSIEKISHHLNNVAVAIKNDLKWNV